MVWKPGVSGNPLGRAKQPHSITATLDRLCQTHAPQLKQALLDLLHSDDPTDRATFWRVMGKRVASVDAETVQPGNVLVIVGTGVPSLLPSAVTGQVASGAGDPPTPLPPVIDCEAGTKGLANGPAESNG